MELGRPPYTHDCRLGSPINADTEGHTDSIMAKHRKDRDSWGECTYNISYFQRALTHRSVFLHNAAEARTLHKSMFISSSTTSSSGAFRYIRGKYVFISTPMWLVGREITRFFICFVSYCGPVMQKRADIKKYYVSKDVFNKHTGWAVLVPPKGLKHPPWFHFDRWASQVLCAASATKLCNIASVNLTAIRFKPL